MFRMSPNALLRRLLPLASVFVCFSAFAQTDNDYGANDHGADEPTRITPAVAPDIRDDDIPGKIRSGDFVVVPIPISNPTLDNGLIAVGAYFYPQSEAQEKVQPASVTGVAAMYTSNDSKAFLLGHQSYWGGDKWRLGGGVGYADINLTLPVPDAVQGRRRVNWNIEADLAFAKLSYAFMGEWYATLSGRYIDAVQALGLGAPPDSLGADPTNFDLSGDIRSVGIGVGLEHDSRDLPLNSYSGHKFELSALFNNENLGSNSTYQSYKLEYSSYHELSVPVVLAWQLYGCSKEGTVPIWDGCLIPLRGFSAVDYIGTKSFAAQIEARWRLGGRWGVTGFAGGGTVDKAIFPLIEEDFVPSYGVGLRFMVLQSKRINLRLDYARSEDDDAWHLSVGEAF